MNERPFTPERPSPSRTVKRSSPGEKLEPFEVDPQQSQPEAWRPSDHPSSPLRLGATVHSEPP